jgi:Ras-related protein Rab-8A
MELDAEDEYDFLQKVIIVGDSAVGKTCLLLRFCEDEFTPNFISTIGIDFQAKTFLVDKDRVRMQARVPTKT